MITIDDEPKTIKDNVYNDPIVSSDKRAVSFSEVIETDDIIDCPKVTDCGQTFWDSVEQNLRVHNKLSLLVTERKGIERSSSTVYSYLSACPTDAKLY